VRIYLFLDPEGPPVDTREMGMPEMAPALTTDGVSGDGYRVQHHWVRLAPRKYILAGLEAHFDSPDLDQLASIWRKP